MINDCQTCHWSLAWSSCHVTRVFIEGNPRASPVQRRSLEMPWGLAQPHTSPGRVTRGSVTRDINWYQGGRAGIRMDKKG